MRTSLLNHLPNNLEALHEISPEETSRSLAIEVAASDIEEKMLSQIIREVGENPEVSISFTTEAKYSDDRPPIPVLIQRGSGFRVPNRPPSEVPDWYNDFRKSASFFVDEKNYLKLSNEIQELTGKISEGTVVLSLRIRKISIEEVIEEKVIGEDMDEKVQIHFWTSTDKISEWIREQDITNVVEELFPEDALPIFVFLENRSFSDDYLLNRPVDDVESLSAEDIKTRHDTYKRRMKEASRMFEFSGLTNPVSPVLFPDDESRDIFEPVCIYGAVGSIVESGDIKGGLLSSWISSNKREFTDTIDLNDSDFQEGELRGLVDFYSIFAERGGSKVYRDIWYRAIVEYCGSIQDIPNSASDITHYYESLEQKAIEGNFTELSGAVQDAQIFIGDVTNSLSSSTVNLTSEIQKVVFVFFGILGVNIFLLARETGLGLAVPFSAVLSSGILLIYLPTAQERVNELSSFITEGKKDAKVYTELVENVGADQLVDLSKFEDRQEAYVGLAKNRVEWANMRLKQACVLMSLLWLISGVIGAAVFPLLSTVNAFVFLTVPVGIWIRYKHTEYEYLDSFEYNDIRVNLPLAVSFLILASQLVFYFLF